MADEGAFPRKKIATKAKHLILQEYVKAWGGIILHSMHRKRGLRPIVLGYLDTCCGGGVYEGPGDRDEIDTLGSPIIALRALRELVALGESLGLVVEARAMLVNTSSTELEALRRHVSREALDGVDVVYEPGEFAAVAGKACGFLHDHFGLVLIDPYGPSAIPFNAVFPLVSQSYNDCLVHFSTNGLKRWAGSALKAKAERTPDEEKIVEMGTAFFGTADWIETARKDRPEGKCENALVQLYRNKLEASGVRTLAVPLLFCDQNQTKYHLVFTSRNVAGLASMKEKLQKGDLYQRQLRHRLLVDREESSKGPWLFEPEPDLSSMREVDKEAVRAAVLALLNERKRAEFQDVVAACLDLPNVLERHVRSAVTGLRKDGRVACTQGKIKYHDVVTLVDP